MFFYRKELKKFLRKTFLSYLALGQEIFFEGLDDTEKTKDLGLDQEFLRSILQRQDKKVSIRQEKASFNENYIKNRVISQRTREKDLETLKDFGGDL